MKIYCAFLILWIVLYFDFSIKIKAKFSVLKLNGVFFVKIFGFNVARGVLLFDKNCATFRVYIKVLKKLIYFNLNNDKQDEHSLSSLPSFVPSFYVSQADLSFDVGKKDDGFVGSMLYSALKITLINLIDYISLNYRIKFYLSGNVSNETKIELKSRIYIEMSLFYAMAELARYLVAKIKFRSNKKEVKIDRRKIF